MQQTLQSDFPEMRQFLAGVLYDTRKAHCVGTVRFREGPQIQHFNAGLYRTPRSGKYFLCGVGGAMTPFYKVTQASARRGPKIIPLETKPCAAAWARAYLPPSRVEQEFPS